jgi:hypothetical protein
MSKLSNIGKDIPATESDFVVEVEGEVTKRRFIGDFSCKIPRKKEQCLIDKHRAFLNGPQPEQLSPETLRFHHMISYLRYTLDDKGCPKWWKESDLGYELYDENVVKSVYDKVLEFEVEWLKAVWGEEAVNKLQTGKENDEAKEKGT